MTRSKDHSWLNRFAWFTAAATFLLLGVGGLVTSHEAGMAVPDWPTTYGYNMFLFPIHLWTGGIFYEHTHRLVASLVGLLTAVLAVWLWWREPRAWMRWLGFGAFLAVVCQGVLGGLRVTLYKDQLGIVHAALAQIFFVTVSLIALLLSNWGETLMRTVRAEASSVTLRFLLIGATGLTFGQLILGATMRHQHAGLAVPDFPLAYGRLWPRMDAASVAKVNARRMGIEDYKPITAAQIGLHMAHRLGALTILVFVAAAAWRARSELGRRSGLARVALFWLVLTCLQATLGAATVWSGKAADVATAHVLTGALSLWLGTVAGLWTLGPARGQCSRAAFEPEQASVLISASTLSRH